LEVNLEYEPIQGLPYNRSSSIYTNRFNLTKTFKRSQLPQLDGLLLERSGYTFSLELVNRNEIRPVQNERVKNLKKHEKRLIKARTNSYRPLVLDRHYFLVDGHHRLDALTELGIETVRTYRVNALINEMVKVFAEYAEDIETYEATTSIALN
tara:strand:- start:161 stop:619 length:459 start_codon:yes stop_codon:yes gene_type:complete